MGGKTLDGGDVVKQAAAAHSDTKTRTQEMFQAFVCAGGLYAIRAEAKLATSSAGPEELWKGSDPRKACREEAAHTLTSAGPGWKNA